MASITPDHPFLGKHGETISGVLSCFDRVIFLGHSPMSYPLGVEGFLWRQGVPLKDFGKYALSIADRIRDHIKAVAAKAGAPYRHLPRKEPMEEQARRLALEKGIVEGIVCAYSQLETCRTYRFEYRGRPRLRKDYRRCSVLYVFVMHKVLGLIHVKIQTWFPLTMQVYVNGHDFLAKKLTERGIGYAMHDNAFLRIDNMEAAQGLADGFAKLNWPRLLGELARQFNPLVGREMHEQDYYWVMNQAEYATDVIFKEAAALAAIYPRLVEHARACLGAEDVLKFLGRKLHPSLQGEVQTHVSRRIEGVRVVHRMKANKLKMYDKGGIVLRIETTINDPGEFQVRRKKEGQPGLHWQRLPKGVAWLWRYAEVSARANSQYLAAMTVVENDQASRLVLEEVTRPTRYRGRTRRGLQPLSAADQELFLAALRGDHRLRGFRNRDLTARLYPGAPRDRNERRRRAARVTRLIQLLRAHGLIAKIPRARRYRVTRRGDQFMNAAIYVRHKYFPLEIQHAA